MAESVTYSRIVELLDNSAYLAALKKAEDEEKTVTALRTAGGTAAVKALRETEKAQQQQAKEAAKAAAAEMAAAQKKAEYLERLRIQSYKDEQKAAERAERDAQKAAAGPSAWTLALQANTKAINDQRGAINQGAEGLGKFSAIVAGLSPELAAVTGGLQKAVGATSAVGTAFNAAGASAAAFEAAALPITAVLAAGAFAWTQYNDNVKKGEERLKEAREEADKFRSTIEKLADAQFTASLDAQVLAGEISEVEAAQRKAAHGINADYGAAIDSATRKMDTFKGKIAEIDDTLSKGEMGVDRRKLEADREQLVGALEEARNEYDQLNGTINVLIDTTEGNIKKTGENTEKKKEATEAEKANKDAIKASAEATRERERDEAALLKLLLAEADAESKRAATVEKARGSLDGLRRSSELALATEEEKIKLAAQASREAAVAAANEAQAASNSSAEKKRIYQDLSATIININVDEQRQLQAIEEAKTATAKAEADKRAEEEAAAAKRTAAEISEAYSMTSDALGDYFDSVLDASTDKIGELEEAIKAANENGAKSKAASLQKQLAAEKEAATKAFKWQQALSASNATVNWLEALVKATTYGPVGGPLVAGAATLAYGLSLKQIEAEQPTFSDTPPGGYRMGPEGQTVRGAANDTAILFRDPLEGFAQAVEVMARRQAPTSSPKRGGRSLLGVSAATTPVSRLLTRDVERATRGKL